MGIYYSRIQDAGGLFQGINFSNHEDGTMAEKMVLADRVDTSRLITHTFHGLDKIDEALQLMKDKPADLIKPIVYCD